MTTILFGMFMCVLCMFIYKVSPLLPAEARATFTTSDDLINTVQKLYFIRWEIIMIYGWALLLSVNSIHIVVTLQIIFIFVIY